jgi:pyruvate kinase
VRHAQRANARVTPQDIRRDVAAASALRAVEELRRSALTFETEFAEALSRSPPVRRESLRNLLHYLALRRHDVRELQYTLARLGLSSLGRLESHVLASLNAVLDVLYRHAGKPVPPEVREPPPIDFDTGRAVLTEHAIAVLGPPPQHGPTRIMVTLPSEAAADAALVADLVGHGMQIARINCAHDDATAWAAMVRNVRAAARRSGTRCLISFDLAGPKLRINAVAPGPAAARWHPRRDAFGTVIEPATVVLAAPGADAPAGSIPVDAELVRRARAGDTIELTDNRGRERSLAVRETTHGALVCTADATAFVRPGVGVTLHRHGKRVLRGAIGDIAPPPGSVTLAPGDMLDLVLGDRPGRDAVRDPRGAVAEPAFVSCALPEVFRAVRVGDRVMFDDGKVVGTVHEASEERMRIHVAQCAGGRARLRGEKGINFPDSELALPALTDKDRADLAFAARHADLVALSFVQRPEDVEALLAELARLKASHLGVVLKIETHRAFRDLPRLLIAAMRHPGVAVMVARGDLGVEVGFERLSEVQEEILWLCEAAHAPVIWATQVLESLSKGGMPSRAEVTDAAMASRAECVMLNKGPYIRETLRFLNDVLGRMQAHHDKKTALLRKLSISDIPTAVPERRSRTVAPSARR